MYDFLREFVAYHARRTDAPRDWAMTGGLICLAVALGNRVWTDGRGRRLIPNLYALNLGRSGMGKSVAPDIAKRVLRKANLKRHIADDAYSFESMVDALSEEGTRVFVLQEYAAFHMALSRDYMAGTQQILTQFYDGLDPEDPWTRKLRPGPGSTTPRVTTISDMALNIFGVSTPEWFVEAFKGGPTSSLEGGYLARFLFVPRGVEDMGAYVEDPGELEDGTEAVLADHLRQIREQANGRVDLGQARPIFLPWEKDQRRKLLTCAPEVSGMYARMPDLVKKTMILFQASHDPTCAVIGADAAHKAIAFVEATVKATERFLLTGIAANPTDRMTLRIMDHIVRHGGRALHSTVLRATKYDSGDFKRAILTMSERGDIRVHRSRRGNGGDWLHLPQVSMADL